MTTTYQWFRDAAADHRSRRPATYKLTDADVGASVTVRATGTKPGYQPGTSTSNAVVGRSPRPGRQHSTPPTITGVADGPGDADGDHWHLAGPSGVTYAYQWFVERRGRGQGDQDATSSAPATPACRCSVRVTATATGWGRATATSAAVPVAKLASTTTATAAKTKITAEGSARCSPSRSP